MIDFNIAELIHRQIILDLSIRTLERDRKYIKDLKMHQAFEEWFEIKIKELNNELRATKSELSKRGVKIQSETKVDDLVTEIAIIDRGNLHTRRYMNIALRNWCIDETKRLLGLSYRTIESWQEKKTT